MYIISQHFHKKDGMWTLKALFNKVICRWLKAKIKYELVANNKPARQFCLCVIIINLSHKGINHQENTKLFL